jgi:hypothetical protein
MKTIPDELPENLFGGYSLYLQKFAEAYPKMLSMSADDMIACAEEIVAATGMPRELARSRVASEMARKPDEDPREYTRRLRQEIVREERIVKEVMSLQQNIRSLVLNPYANDGLPSDLADVGKYAIRSLRSAECLVAIARLLSYTQIGPEQETLQTLNWVALHALGTSFFGRLVLNKVVLVGHHQIITAAGISARPVFLLPWAISAELVKALQEVVHIRQLSLQQETASTLEDCLLCEEDFSAAIERILAFPSFEAGEIAVRIEDALALELHARANQPPAPRRPGRPSADDSHRQLYEEYQQAREEGKAKNQAEFARMKGLDPSTISKAFKPFKKAGIQA